MNGFPRGERECECAACHRGFVGLGAFDAHRQGFRCLEPSSIGLWLATDGLWSVTQRDAEAEERGRRARGVALKQAQEDLNRRARSDEQDAQVPVEGSAPHGPHSGVPAAPVLGGAA